jgi:hypothetical protein
MALVNIIVLTDITRRSFNINLDDEILIGKVNYIDYSTGCTNDFDLLELVVTKSQHDNRRLVLGYAAKELFKIEPFKQNRSNSLTKLGDTSSRPISVT